MEHNDKFNFKEVLLSFLNNGDFVELQVDCGHVPIWFKYELENLHLNSKVESIGSNILRVSIYHA